MSLLRQFVTRRPSTRLFRRRSLFILIAALLLIWARTPESNSIVHAAGASDLPPGTLVHAASCEQAPPQSVKDRATYTAAELARYGLPPRAPGEPFAKWANIVRSVEKRVCDYTIGVGHWWVIIHNGSWAGFVADESSPGQNYSEADMDYYVPCISTATLPPSEETAAMAAWVGIGGNGHDKVPLVQAGTAAFQYWDNVHGWHNQYRTFVENTGSDPNHPAPPHYFFDVSCNTHIYASAWAGDCMVVIDLDNHVSTGNQCYGPAANNQSGEAIVERSPDLGDYPYFAHFLPVTFHGVAITDNGNYLPMYKPPHNQDQPDECEQPAGGGICSSWYIWATTSAIELDPNENPNDKYTVTWQNY